MSNVRYKEIVLLVRIFPKFCSVECQFCGEKKVSEIKCLENAVCYLSPLEIQNAGYYIKKPKKFHSEGIVKFC